MKRLSKKKKKSSVNNADKPNSSPKIADKPNKSITKIADKPKTKKKGTLKKAEESDGPPIPNDHKVSQKKKPKKKKEQDAEPEQKGETGPENKEQDPGPGPASVPSPKKKKKRKKSAPLSLLQPPAETLEDATEKSSGLTEDSSTQAHQIKMTNPNFTSIDVTDDPGQDADDGDETAIDTDAPPVETRKLTQKRINTYWGVAVGIIIALFLTAIIGGYYESFYWESPELGEQAMRRGHHHRQNYLENVPKNKLIHTISDSNSTT